MAWRVSLFVLAALLLGAHFLREGNWVVTVLCLCTPLLLLYRRRWVLAALQILAYGAAATWITVAAGLVQVRQAEGRSWTLAVVILGATALVTLLAGLLLNSRLLKDRYPP